MPSKILELMMTGTLKKIMYNCRQATILIEKKMFGKISAAENIQLQIHLAGCSVCKTYQHQSMLINRLIAGFEANNLKLDDQFKISLKERIESEMNKN